jgi:hypothetical protein
MAAETIVNLIVNQRASFDVTYHVKRDGVPLDLTDYTAGAKFKQDIAASDESAIAFTTNITNAANGSINIALTPTQTAAMQIGKYVYDVSITNNTTSFKTRIVEGKISVSGGVS